MPTSTRSSPRTPTRMPIASSPSSSPRCASSRTTGKSVSCKMRSMRQRVGSRIRSASGTTCSRYGERWLEGTFCRRARAEGNDVGYESIVAGGPHATTLHWIENDGPVTPGTLILLDMGVENRSLYTADITRTLPVDGTFTDDQRHLYGLVLAAQEAGMAAVTPGAAYRDFHVAAMTVLAHGLADMGILPCSAEEALDKDSGIYRRWTLHGTGHMLGMDVHDCSRARSENYLEGSSKPAWCSRSSPASTSSPATCSCLSPCVA